MYSSVTWDKSKSKQKPPAEERAEGKGIDCEKQKIKKEVICQTYKLIIQRG